jgi:hypothetical protein
MSKLTSQTKKIPVESSILTNLLCAQRSCGRAHMVVAELCTRADRQNRGTLKAQPTELEQHKPFQFTKHFGGNPVRAAR